MLPVSAFHTKSPSVPLKGTPCPPWDFPVSRWPPFCKARPSSTNRAVKAMTSQLRSGQQREQGAPWPQAVPEAHLGISTIQYVILGESALNNNLPTNNEIGLSSQIPPRWCPQFSIPQSWTWNLVLTSLLLHLLYLTTCFSILTSHCPTDLPRAP